MDLEVRPITADEVHAFQDVASVAFGEPDPTDEERLDRARFLELDRSVGSFDRGRLVGTASAYTLELTLPGPAIVPAAGVTAVAVLPTHRRRGALRAMMAWLFAQAEERGEPVAILIASEATIYERFGYGVATSALSVEIDTSHGGFARPLDDPGSVRFVTPAEARLLVPPLFDRVRRARPGDIDRDDAYWDLATEDPAWFRGRAGNRRWVVHEAHGGAIDGYLTYRRTAEWRHSLPAGALELQEVVATTPEANAALWRVALDADLVTTVTAHRLPVDDPIRHLLADPRRLRVTSRHDGLWLRLLDIPRVLASRTYSVPGRLVLEIVDGHLPGNDGCYLLEADADGAACARTDDPPDLGMSAADLASVLLGGVAPSTLAGAGRVHGLRPEALALADTMFASFPAPFLSTGF
ncbi:MAG: GNAT family N-acetyltransferase [Acidimicrobiales bacterium]|nr:GNAT family N-acetyltransferase [Acidimicrobiales bacterium]